MLLVTSFYLYSSYLAFKAIQKRKIFLILRQVGNWKRGEQIKAKNHTVYNRWKISESHGLKTEKTNPARRWVWPFSWSVTVCQSRIRHNLFRMVAVSNLHKNWTLNQSQQVQVIKYWLLGLYICACFSKLLLHPIFISNYKVYSGLLHITITVLCCYINTVY